MIREQLHKIVIQSDSKRGRYFDLSIQFLILLSLVTFSLETIPNHHARKRRNRTALPERMQ